MGGGVILGCVRNKDELWNHLKLTIYDLRDQFVPKTTTSGKPSWNTNGRPRAEPMQEVLFVKKTTSHRRWMSAKYRSDGETARLEYTRARNNVTRLMRKAKREFEKGICLKSKSRSPPDLKTKTKKIFSRSNFQVFSPVNLTPTSRN